MPTAYAVHILAGAVGLVAGFIALYSTKGGPLHRRAGRAFVYAMVTMCALGIAIAIGRGKAPALNVSVALLTTGLVISALTTMRPQTRLSRRLDLAATITMLAVGLAALPLAISGIASGDRIRAAQAYPLPIFGAIALCAAAGDWRVRR